MKILRILSCRRRRLCRRQFRGLFGQHCQDGDHLPSVVLLSCSRGGDEVKGISKCNASSHKGKTHSKDNCNCCHCVSVN